MPKKGYNRHGRKTYKKKSTAKKNRRKGGKIYKVKDGYRISYK
jgi:hypothetical protein